MAKKATRRIRLNHNCGMPGCVGMSGDVIEVPEAKARLLVEERLGAVYVDQPEPELVAVETTPEVPPAAAPAETTPETPTETVEPAAEETPADDAAPTAAKKSGVKTK